LKALDLMPWQKEAVALSYKENDLFFSCSMGVGKTCATIQVLRHRYSEAGHIKNTLILAPLIVLENWRREILMFSKIPDRAITVLHGTGKKRKALMEKVLGYSGIVICNYETMQMKDVYSLLQEWSPEILVCDESHLLKNPASKRAKAVARLADRAQHKYLLTGTPVLNSAMDLFMQYRILDGHLGPHSTFGSNFFVFRNTYFYDENAQWKGKSNYFPKWEPRESTYSELAEKIAKKTLIVTKKDVLKDLPPLVTEERFAELGTEQARMYKEVRQEYVSFLEGHKDNPDKAVIARLAITKALRLQQIVTGFVGVGEGARVEPYFFDKVPRLEALKVILEELAPNHKVIVWSIFKENYKMIARVCEELGVGFTEIHGGVTAKNKFLNQDIFNKDPDCRVLIGNPGAGGVGINLVASSYSVYYSRGFKLGDDLQSEARNHRKGSEVHDKITRINIVAPNTIDELINEALSKKQNIAKEILEWKI
jgi:SNF2 family DNA or RNA helicase